MYKRFLFVETQTRAVHEVVLIGIINTLPLRFAKCQGAKKLKWKEILSIDGQGITKNPNIEAKRVSKGTMTRLEAAIVEQGVINDVRAKGDAKNIKNAISQKKFLKYKHLVNFDLKC